jgi:trehalose 2-sulfotransferase
MLCASPRSGSTLLCDMLSRTGVAGAPASYLRPASIAWYSTEWRVPASQGVWDERYLAAIRHHSANGSGCPALRIMWSDMPAVLARLRTIDPTLISDRARVQRLLGIEHFVHLRRNDLVAQAVSLVLAGQTGIWHKNADGSAREIDSDGAEPIYDEQRIAAELRMLEVEAEGWETWFESQSISPVRLTYEDLAADPAKALTDVLEAIGRPVRPPLPGPGTARLAKHINDEWASKFQRQRES